MTSETNVHHFERRDKNSTIRTGCFPNSGDEQTKEACLEAFKFGYRHIDTAHAYQNERGVGQAVKESGIPREEIWITTKLWPSEYGEGQPKKAIDKMLERLGTDYIDLLLLHQQFKHYLGAWKDMEKAVGQGKVKSIGLSNFESERLKKCSLPQRSTHPFFRSSATLIINKMSLFKKRIAPYNTIIESWYPLDMAMLP